MKTKTYYKKLKKITYNRVPDIVYKEQDKMAIATDIYSLIELKTDKEPEFKDIKDIEFPKYEDIVFKGKGKPIKVKFNISLIIKALAILEAKAKELKIETTFEIEMYKDRIIFTNDKVGKCVIMGLSK